MKNLIIGLIVLTVFSCKQSGTTKSKMEQATIIEMVMWQSVEGINAEEAKESITKLNAFVSEQSGFISRKTAMAEDGKFLDIVYWTDLKSARDASEKAIKTKELIPIFSKIDQKEMIFQHFEIFNSIENN